MTSLITETKDIIARIPWREYLVSQIYKIIGFIVLAILIIGTMIFSEQITDLETMTIEDPIYVITVALSSICFILVLIGFSKIVLFDMANEFGLRDEETNKMIYDTRFFLFAALALSFCSTIYLLLDVFLQDTYLEILPVLVMEWVLVATEASISGLTDIGRGREFYQTARNIYFAFFFIVIIIFSVLVFLSILTTLGRNRVASRFKKEEEEEEEEEENRRLYKVLAWLLIPFVISFLYTLLPTAIGPVVGIVILVLFVWWLYQLLKTVFLIFWRGFKITAFITSVNALLIIPLALVLYGLPVISWTLWDIWLLIQEGTISFEIPQIIQAGFPLFQNRLTDLVSIIQLDFIFITIIATFIVGFAEGFAIVAIFSAIFRGVEVTRTGHIIARSPPKVMVISKYIIMLGVWVSLVWDSFISILQMLKEYFAFTIDFEIPSLIFLIYNEIINPLVTWLETFMPMFRYIPFLLLPLYFILAGAFKFLSVTLVTPRVKERLSAFFLLISTAFVLIITNILGDIYLIQRDPNFTGVQDAPLMGLQNIFSSAVEVFQYVEALAFYAGFLFGLLWVIRHIIRSRRQPTVSTITATLDEIESVEEVQETPSKEEVEQESQEDDYNKIGVITEPTEEGNEG
ncbi:MAG: hypothetical protein ACFE9L_10125 [Candidatus Hodarchaeota archaeon]